MLIFAFRVGLHYECRCVVSHLSAEATQFAMGVIYLFQEKSRNVNVIPGFLFKCNSAGVGGLSSRPERVRQLYSGFYSTPDFGRNAELRISSSCSPIPNMDDFWQPAWFFGLV
jgi:hypothetical protein